MRGFAVKFVVLLLLAADGAGAQPSSVPDPRAAAEAAFCGSNAPRGAYTRCALWFEEGVLRRGTFGPTLAVEGWMRPIPLTRFVADDSARAYAAVYEHKTLVGNWFGYAGLELLADGLLAGLVPCHVRRRRDRGGQAPEGRR
jgi:hypothetical protein